MGFNLVADHKPHAVCVPYPAQGHINPMFKLAKLLHFKGFHITFVNTEYNQKRLLKSRGPNSVAGLPDFRFEAIPDGLPVTDNDNTTQDIPSLCESTSKNCLVPFRNLLYRLNNTSSSSNVSPVSCIVSDGSMSFTLEAAEELGIPQVLFWTPSACGVLAYAHYPFLVERGFIPLKGFPYIEVKGDSQIVIKTVKDRLVPLKTSFIGQVILRYQLSNKWVPRNTIDWIPGMKNIRLKDLPSFIRTTDPNEIMLNFVPNEISKVPRASALILNTFDALEQDVLDVLSSMFPLVYSIGPLHELLSHQISDYHEELANFGSNLWKVDSECIKWLDSQEPGSVVYVNFGSIAVMTPFQLAEFAWGLANSNKPFLWIARPDLVTGDSVVLSSEFVAETKERYSSDDAFQLTEFAWGLANSKKPFLWITRTDLVTGDSVVLSSEFVAETKRGILLAGWCPQEEVLTSINWRFLSHMGWNSTIESVSAGVPMLVGHLSLSNRQIVGLLAMHGVLVWRY
ncbi:hypothetical protein GH714_027284 [Hevea brasiliensis]|uniref:Uncharacterized protein n=1 Tax=Hevea brasiliensis TaxID=3981 RepID=A0A6A6N2F6_HEVBR|nr:hypothetical protein GH714_027284 [Hevea brasiliensis]